LIEKEVAATQGINNHARSSARLQQIKDNNYQAKIYYFNTSRDEEEIQNVLVFLSEIQAQSDDYPTFS
jgi:hypothetical protein